MPLSFQPKAKSVVMCDFSGFVVPEMVKTRPVVVIAKHKRNPQLVTVVPLSTTVPTVLEDHHHELSKNPLPDKPHITCWAKCDMVATVSLQRLDRYRIHGTRNYVVPVISEADFQAIRHGVIAALGLSHIASTTA
ncbi:MAG TPA: type II toxin-antitoxin system PemK/MazF family toxin [Rhodocyclaceae bacterium]|nr:type II toxin-antitoxin system PemK/MazF family toxin [Rhodocyclaceae bacterium]